MADTRCNRNTKLALILALGALVFADLASAQDIPDKVSTDVSTAKEGGSVDATFSAAPTAPTEPPKEEAKADVDWTISAGGALNTGNTKSWTVNAGSDFKLVKGDHHLTAAALFNYGRADTISSVGYETTVKKFLFTSRYDYFLTTYDAVWVSAAERWDRFAGFDTQFLAQGGYLRAFVKKENHYLAGRVGYSYTYENFVVTPPTHNHIHGVLAALDYENQLNEHVQFLTGITTIANVNEIDEQNADPFEDIRIYYTAALVAKMTDKLSAEARFLLLYDRLPPPTTQKTDTTTIFSLIYTLQ